MLAVASLKWVVPRRPHLVMQHAKPVPTAGSISLGTLSTPPTPCCPSVFSSLCSSRSNYDYSAVWHMLLRRHSGGVGEGPIGWRHKAPLNAPLSDVLYEYVCVSVCLLIQDIGLSYYTPVTSHRCGGGGASPGCRLHNLKRVVSPQLVRTLNTRVQISN